MAGGTLKITQMRDTADNRRFPRHLRPGKVRMHWKDAQGHSHQANAKCLDISRTGIRVSLEKPVEPMTLVNLQSPDFRIAGVAMVRHCTRKGLGFEAGLQFAGGLEWFRAPEGE